MRCYRKILRISYNEYVTSEEFHAKRIEKHYNREKYKEYVTSEEFHAKIQQAI